MSSGPVVALDVIRAGPLASLQDAGRFGVRYLGITQGGAVDLHAWAWANQLVGNAWGAAALEVTFGGLQLQASRDITLALCGADLGATIDGVAVAPWRAFQLAPGQVLGFAAPRLGMRAYLAVAGGFQAEPVLGSRAGVAREALGGHDGEGRQLAVGDALRVKAPVCSWAPSVLEVPPEQRPDYRQQAVLGLVPGAQIGAFSGRSLFDAFNAEWTVDSRSDRMGIRLAGPVLTSGVGNLVSEGIALGAVQVPPDGQPIVLLNDRQTIGGYPRLGTLTPLACSRLAQCQPGQTVILRPQPLGRAQAEYLTFRKPFSGSPSAIQP